MYFDDCKTMDELKSKYKDLAKKMHPDIGGDKDKFQRMLEEYTEAVEDITSEPAYLSDEYINLANALAGVVKAKKPEMYRAMEGVVKLAPSILSMFEGNKTAKNMNKFLGKLDI